MKNKIDSHISAINTLRFGVLVAAPEMKRSKHNIKEFQRDSQRPHKTFGLKHRALTTAALAQHSLSRAQKDVRALYIAYGLARGRIYQEIEVDAKTEPDWKSVFMALDSCNLVIESEGVLWDFEYFSLRNSHDITFGEWQRGGPHLPEMVVRYIERGEVFGDPDDALFEAKMINESDDLENPLESIEYGDGEYFDPDDVEKRREFIEGMVGENQTLPAMSMEFRPCQCGSGKSWQECCEGGKVAVI